MRWQLLLLLLGLMTFLCVQIDADRRRILPGWYSDHRVHAHTRLSINEYCSEINASNAEWACDAVFENASKIFKSIGVPTYVRHTHTSNEGTWWPSTSDPKEAWHPLVQDTNRSLPAEFLANAKRDNMTVIFYHYMKTNKYYSDLHPEWVQRWPNGTSIEWSRGTGLSPCADEWQETYIAQIEQLTHMGARAFYLDEFPASQGGDWNEFCRKKFKEMYSNEEMPEDLLQPSSNRQGRPTAADRRVHLLMSRVTQTFFDRISAAVAAIDPTVVVITSIYRVPQITDGYDSPATGTGLYETSALVRSNNTVAKTEIGIPGRAAPPYDDCGDGFDEDTLMSFGFAVARDAASERPPHVWIPGLKNSSRARCAVGGLLVSGCVANPDHSERTMPDHTLFDAIYDIGRKLQGAFRANGDRYGWIDMLFPEQARNAYYNSRATTAWRNVLFPTLGAWDALMRYGAPVNLRMDWQLPGPSTRPLLVPPTQGLDNATRRAIEDFASNGGDVIEIPLSGWNATSSRKEAGDALVQHILQHSRAANPRIRAIASAVRPFHVGAWFDDDAHATGTFAISNAFKACQGGSTEPLPEPMRNVSFRVQQHPSIPENASLVARDILANDLVPSFRVSGARPAEWTVEVGTVVDFKFISLFWTSDHRSSP